MYILLNAKIGVIISVYVMILKDDYGNTTQDKMKIPIHIPEGRLN